MNEVGIHHIQVSSAKITEITHNTQTFIWPNILKLKYFKYVCKRFKRIWPVLARTPPPLPPKLPHSVNSQLTTHGSTPLSAVSANAHQGIRIQTSVAAIATANGNNNNNDDDERPKCLRSLCMCINVALLQRFHISTFRPHLTCWSPTKQLTVCPLCTSFHSLRMFFSFLFYLSFTAHASCPLCAVEMNLWLWLLVSICMPRTLCQYDYQTTTTTAYHPQIYICRITVVVVVVATAAILYLLSHIWARCMFAVVVTANTIFVVVRWTIVQPLVSLAAALF